MFVEMYILKKVEDRFQKMGKRFFFFFHPYFYGQL